MCISTREHKNNIIVTYVVVWLRGILKDVGEEKQVPTIIKCDSHSSIKLINNLVYHGTSKYIKIYRKKNLTWHIALQMKM